MDYSKNKYYKADEIKKAKEKADMFFMRDFTPQLMPNGNHKLPKNVLTFDLPSIITCKSQCKNCYAIKPERNKPSVRIARAYRLEIFLQALKNKNKRKYLIEYIQQEINRHKLLYKMPIVRLHSSGDFFNDKYLEFWLDIIKQNPDIIFYTYTKMYNNKQIDDINRQYKNFNIVKSIIADKYINFGDTEYLKKVSQELTKQKLEYHICDYSTSNATSTCMGNCTACLNCSNILFHKH